MQIHQASDSVLAPSDASHNLAVAYSSCPLQSKR